MQVGCTLTCLNSARSSVDSLNGSESVVITPIRDACQLVLAALAEGKSDSLILENVSADGRSHGISIYLPYLSDEQSAQVNKPLVKGGDLTRNGAKGGDLTRGGAKGFSVSDLLNTAAIGYRISARQDMISLTESYYQGLRLVSDERKPGGECSSSWYDFIAGMWPIILIKTAPAELNLRYSAQQSALNLVSPMARRAASMQAKRAPHVRRMK